MAQHVRNFWLEAKIDGRKTMMLGGPQGKDGGFELTIYIRHDGAVERAVKISGLAIDDDMLHLNVTIEGQLYQVRRPR